MIKYDTITSYSTVWQKHTDLYSCTEWVSHVIRNFLIGTTESSGFERVLLVLGQVCTNERQTHKFCNNLGTMLYISSLFSYHFCNKFNHKIFQQIYTFCVWILVIPKSKHHASQFFGEKSFTS